MDTQAQVLSILETALNLGGRSSGFSASTPLLGALPELDSMGVVALITAFEERLGITVDDDEISGDTFATVGSLRDFVASKLGR
ncbi:MAG: acyl carrier protein [Burkholderiales bacterium]|nr:acyl carrier protein [Burkholderiales bacterium]